MEKMKYESPEFSFQDMRLVEKVADVCWGQAHYAWYDIDKDNEIDENEKYLVKGDSCNDSHLKLNDWLQNTLHLKPGVDFDPKKDTKESINSPIIKPIYS